MSDPNEEDLFGGADVTGDLPEKPAPVAEEEAESQPFPSTQLLERDEEGAYGEDDDESGEESDKKKKEKKESVKKEVLPLCPDIIGRYESLSAMRLPTLIQSVREPYTRESFIAAQKRAHPTLDEADAELLAMRWRRVGDHNESNARLVHWSDGTTQILVGNTAFDVTQSFSGSMLHVAVSLNPSVKQDLGFPSSRYLVEVPKEIAKKRRLLVEIEKARAKAAEDEDEEVDEDLQKILDEFASSSDEEKDEMDDDDVDSDNDDEAVRKKASKGRHSVLMVAPQDSSADRDEGRKKAVAEQHEEYIRRREKKERALKKNAGGTLEADDLTDSDEEDDEGAAERLRRAKDRMLH